MPAGVVLATGFGALGSKVVEHWYELYKMDKQGANLWYGSSTGGRTRSQVCCFLLALNVRMVNVIVQSVV